METLIIVAQQLVVSSEVEKKKLNRVVFFGTVHICWDIDMFTGEKKNNYLRKVTSVRNRGSVWVINAELCKLHFFTQKQSFYLKINPE